MTGPMLTPDQVAELLGCSTRTVRRWVGTGAMPEPVRIGGLIRWPRRTVEAWIAAGCPGRRISGESREFPSESP